VRQIQTNVDIIRHRGIVNAGRFRGNPAPRIGRMRTSLAIALATLGLASFAAAAVELDGGLRDAAARIDYGWYTGDIGLVAAAGDSLAVQRDGPWVHYLRAYAAYREADLRQARGAAAKAAIDTCEREAESAAEARDVEAEATVLIAACAVLAAREEPARALLHQRRFRQALGHSVGLDRTNPRLWLIALTYDRDDGNDLPFDPVAAVEAFRAREELAYPDWGEAEALTRLGEFRLDEGNLRAARDLIEEALLIAPDYSTARRLQGRLAELAQAN
jgi:tetratricopeptide (TPR) repeat protein